MSLTTFVRAAWNGERPPYLRDRCEGACKDGLHYHIPWAGYVGHALILLTVVVIVILVIVSVSP